jgi:methionyl-tRNA formyltransferase
MKRLEKVRTVFIGAGNFAVEILKALQASEIIELIGIVTQPDKPAGRKQILTPCPVRELVASDKKLKEIELFQPEKIKVVAENILNQTKPELIIAADYGQILPKSVIDYPKYKCLNVHGSLLPDLRGAVPTPMAILKGYNVTGVSIPIMTPGLDDGPVLALREEKISQEDTTATLRPRLARIGGELLVEILPKWLSGEIQAVPQDEKLATFTRQNDIAKDKAQITKDTKAEVAERMVRAFNPWPVAWCNICLGTKTVRLKIYEASLCIEDAVPIATIGQLYRKNKEIALQLNGGNLIMKRVQVEGKGISEGNQTLFLAGAGLL